MQLAFQADMSALTGFAGRFGRALAAPMEQGSLCGAATAAAGDYLAAMRARYLPAATGDGTWPDLAPSTKLARLRKAGLRYRRTKGVTRLDRLRTAAAVKLPILIESGRLFDSLAMGSADAYLAIGADRLSAGTAVPYARYHQAGGSVPGRPPRRRILVEPDAELLARMARPVRAAVASLSQDLVRQTLARSA